MAAEKGRRLPPPPPPPTPTTSHPHPHPPLVPRQHRTCCNPVAKTGCSRTVNEDDMHLGIERPCILYESIRSWYESIFISMLSKCGSCILNASIVIKITLLNQGYISRAMFSRGFRVFKAGNTVGPKSVREITLTSMPCVGEEWQGQAVYGTFCLASEGTCKEAVDLCCTC
jgi:hypothetical protein